jgi:hypothetical protein
MKNKNLFSVVPTHQQKKTQKIKTLLHNLVYRNDKNET